MQIWFHYQISHIIFYFSLIIERQVASLIKSSRFMIDATSRTGWSDPINNKEINRVPSQVEFLSQEKRWGNSDDERLDGLVHSDEDGPAFINAPYLYSEGDPWCYNSLNHRTWLSSSFFFPKTHTSNLMCVHDIYMKHFLNFAHLIWYILIISTKIIAGYIKLT